MVPYRTPYAWVLEDCEKFGTPFQYEHKQCSTLEAAKETGRGCVIDPVHARPRRNARRALAGTPTLVGILVEEHLGITFHQLYTNFKDISKENDEAVPT